MKISNIGYLIKEGLRDIFRHGFMSFAAVCVTVACLLIVGSFSILVYNVNIMVEDLNKTSEILVYVDSSLSDAEAKSIGTKINMIPNVMESVFVSREEALQEFIADHADEGEAFTGVEATDLRGGAALVAAGLQAQGITRVEQIHHIERGYADIVRDLAGLGACISRTE